MKWEEKIKYLTEELFRIEKEDTGFIAGVGMVFTFAESKEIPWGGLKVKLEVSRPKVPESDDQ